MSSQVQDVCKPAGDLQNDMIRRKRGRPRKQKEIDIIGFTSEQPTTETFRKRGRHKGSKNKNPSTASFTSYHLESRSVNPQKSFSENFVNEDQYAATQPNPTNPTINLHTSSSKRLPREALNERIDNNTNSSNNRQPSLNVFDISQEHIIANSSQIGNQVLQNETRYRIQPNIHDVSFMYCFSFYF